MKITLINGLLALFLIICTACSSDTTSKDTIVLNNEYEKKEIFIQDIASIEYIPFETTEEALLSHESVIIHIDDTEIIIINQFRCEVLFFSREGKLKNKFSCRGQGPYEVKSYIKSGCWDSQKEELYLNDGPYVKKIYVYDRHGNGKRALDIPQNIMAESIAGFDGESLLIYDVMNAMAQNEPEIAKASKSPYALLSRQDGHEIKRLPFTVPQRMVTSFTQDDAKNVVASTDVNSFLIEGNDFIFADIASDTIFRYTDGKLNVELTKSPLLQTQDLPKKVVAMDAWTKDYCFFRIITNFYDFDSKKGFPDTPIMYNRKSKEFYSYELLNKDFNSGKGKTSFNNMQRETLPVNTLYQLYSSEYLCNQYEAGTIQEGKLHKIASNLEYEDNDVLMLIFFN